MIQKISYYKNKIKNAPFNILAIKVVKKVFAKIRIYYVYKRFKISRFYKSDDYFLSNDLGRSLKKENANNIIFKKIIKSDFYKLITNEKNKEFIIRNIKKGNDIITRADDICNHIFELLGSGRVKVRYNLDPNGVEKYNYSMKVKKSDVDEIKEKINKKIYNTFNDFDRKNYLYIFNRTYEPIDWHIDFKSGYRWDNKLCYKKIKYGENLGADIKVPWELSRFYHLVTLGQAYFLTGDEKYTREFIYQTIDWIENNPPQFGVNWVCTMEVAIRAANWVLGFSYFKESNLVNEKFLHEFIKNLYIHGKHILGNLEYGTLTSNHYISDIAGLSYLGIVFKDFGGSRNWLGFAVNELVNEMKKQVYSDGVDFEASTCYHRLVLELFFYPTLFIVKKSPYFKGSNFVEAGEKIFGKNYIKKLYKIFEFVLFSLKPDGRMPQIGDNDNGRLHIFCGREILDMKYLLCLGAVFFKEQKFKIKEFGFCEESLWVFGKDSYDIWNNLDGESENNIGSRSFPNAGWYILRKDKDYMIVSCGPNGQNGNGGHAHNDKLSFEFSVEGRDILLDPGTYLYTPVPYWRNKFRSTLFHNTVVTDRVEQNRFNDKSLFFLENDVECKINLWNSTESYDFLDAEHYGYRRLKYPVIHRRQIFYDKIEDYWIVRDLLTGRGEHKFDWCFHIAENIIFDVDEDSLIVNIDSSINNDENIRLKIIPLDINGVQLFKYDGWLSHGYGEKISSIMLVYSKTARIPTEFIFVIAVKKFNYSKDYVLNLLERYSK